MGDWGYLILKIAITVAVILALTGLVYWLVRRYSAIGLGGIGRGRVPRLAVVDALTVDRRRRLLLVRRDNVEHLILIGGPSDLVVEATIQRTRTRQASRAAAPASAPSDMPVMHELAQSGLAAHAQAQSAEPVSTPDPVSAAPSAEAPAADRDRSVPFTERPAPPYRAEMRSRGAIDTRQLLESISETRQHHSPSESPSGAYGAPPAQGRELRIVASEPPPEAPEVLAPSRDPTATNISDLEQEMARLLGQLNVKRP